MDISCWIIVGRGIALFDRDSALPNQFPMRSQCDLSVESRRGGAHETPLDLRFPSLAKLNDFNPSPTNISPQPQTLFEKQAYNISSPTPFNLF
jgi:hypothetical protein